MPEVSHSLLYRPSRYQCDVGSRHIETPRIPYDERRVAASRVKWDDAEMRMGEFSRTLDGTVYWGGSFAKIQPDVIDMALEIDGSGNTKFEHEPSMATRWIEVDGLGIYLRFSRARTALHSGRALRTPVMAKGIAIETTLDPESLDIRDAHTMFIAEPKKEGDSRYPWTAPRAARLFDMSQFYEEPYFAGPLYNGHPNEVNSESRQHQVVELARDVFKKLIETLQD